MRLETTSTRREGEIPFQLGRLIGSRTGVVSGLHVFLGDRDDPDTVATEATLGALDELMEDDHEDYRGLAGAGKGFSRAESLKRAVGEAVERYCAYFPDFGRTTLGSYREVRESGSAVVDFDYLDTFEAAQYETMTDAGLVTDQFDRDTPLRWSEGRDLLTGEHRHLPTQLVYLRHDHDLPICLPRTTNGLAAGTSLEAALTGSIREVVERDAFARTWYRGARPEAVVPKPGSGLSELQKQLENYHLSSHLFDFDPVVECEALGCALVDDRDRSPKFVLGGAASLGFGTAARQALMEAAQGWPYAKYLTLTHAGEAIDPDRITDFERNVVYYSRPEHFDAVRFLTTGPDSTRVPRRADRRDSLEEWLSVLRAAGCTPIAFDVTTRDIREVGLFVTRVCIPELIGLPVPSFPPRDHPELRGVRVSGQPHPYP